MFKKSSAILLSILMASSLATCSSNNNKDNNKPAETAKASNNAGTNATASTNTGGDTAIDTSKFVKIKYLVLGNKPTNGQFDKVMGEVNKIMKEKSMPSWNGNGLNGRTGKPNITLRLLPVNQST